MNSTNLFAVHFMVRPLKSELPEAMIYVRISVGRSRLEFSLRKKVLLAYWDQKGGCVKSNKKLMQELNPSCRTPGTNSWNVSASLTKRKRN